MPTPADFLKTLGESLAAYDRPRVARLGCFSSLAILGGVLVAWLAGMWPGVAFFPGLFRILILCALGAAVLVFFIFAAMETMAEKRALESIRAFVKQGGADLPSLLEMAKLRSGRFAGSDRVISLLERALRA
jgi:hypothetical protein